MSGLWVSSLMLSHFRSHKRAEMQFDGRPVAIYGANGAGKTNVIEAISLMSPGRGLRRAVAADMMRQPDALGWKIAAEISRNGQIFEVETWADPGGTRQVRIDGKATTQLALGKITPVVWLVPAMDRLWTESAEGRRRFLDRMVLSFVPDHGEAVLSYEKSMRERNRLLKDQVRDASWYAVLEGRMAALAIEIQANRHQVLDRIKTAMAGADSPFPIADLDITGHSDDLTDIWAATRSQDVAAGRTLIGPHRADLLAVYAAKSVAAKDCSTGEQKALLISLVLANARALAQDVGVAPILLLDEVSAHLDIHRRADLYNEICALKAQAFLTGTGPELFAELGDRAEFMRVSEDAGLSKIDVNPRLEDGI